MATSICRITFCWTFWSHLHDFHDIGALGPLKAILAWNYRYKKYTNYQCIFIVVGCMCFVILFPLWNSFIVAHTWQLLKFNQVAFEWLWISNGNYGGILCSFVHGSHLDGLQICSKIFMFVSVHTLQFPMFNWRW
jgi:hypothetical protein